ncbi:MAG: hypothetical protein P8Z71_07410 [Candidatus Sulfobium sp.]|jgi:tetratricopeptide (TPR) repeat protein
MMKMRPGLTSIKRFLVVLVVLLFALTAGCAASKEYRMSLDFYNKGQYQQALKHIEQALVDDPYNKKYIRLRTRIYRDRDRYKRIFLGFQ